VRQECGCGDGGVQGEVLVEAVADSSFQGGVGLWERQLECEADPGDEDQPVWSGEDAVDAGESGQAGVVDRVVFQPVAGDLLPNLLLGQSVDDVPGQYEPVGTGRSGVEGQACLQGARGGLGAADAHDVEHDGLPVEAELPHPGGDDGTGRV